MSLIGPRPERPELEEELTAIPHYRKRYLMTGLERLGSSVCTLCQQHRRF